MDWFEKLEFQLDDGDWISLYKRPLLFDWLMRAVGSGDMCIELFGKLWVPKKIEDLKAWAASNKPLLYHERTHARQQAAVGEFKWYWGYTFNKDFRLDAEAEAYAVQLKHLPLEDRDTAIRLFSKWLAGPEYSHAASSDTAAFFAISKYMGD